jgi:hypothetical protein
MKSKVTYDEYRSADGKLRAEVVKTVTEHLHVNFYENDVKIASETYDDHSIRYYEDAAENYVNGIKKV